MGFRVTTEEEIEKAEKFFERVYVLINGQSAIACERDIAMEALLHFDIETARIALEAIADGDISVLHGCYNHITTEEDRKFDSLTKRWIEYEKNHDLNRFRTWLKMGAL
jgi:hypothetical protein